MRVFKGSHVGSWIIHQITQLEVPLGIWKWSTRCFPPPVDLPRTACCSIPPRDHPTGIDQALADDAFFPCPEPGTRNAP